LQERGTRGAAGRARAADRQPQAAIFGTEMSISVRALAAGSLSHRVAQRCGWPPYQLRRFDRRFDRCCGGALRTAGGAAIAVLYASHGIRRLLVGDGSKPDAAQCDGARRADSLPARSGRHSAVPVPISEDGPGAYRACARTPDQEVRDPGAPERCEATRFDHLPALSCSNVAHPHLRCAGDADTPAATHAPSGHSSNK